MSRTISNQWSRYFKPPYTRYQKESIRRRNERSSRLCGNTFMKFRSRMQFCSYLTLMAVANTTCSKIQQAPLPVSATSCADFLARASHAIEHLAFKGCSPDNQSQQILLRATYSVEGKNAKYIEKKLIRRFSMKPLRFICCGWESPGGAGSFSDSANKRYSVSMHSGETLETNWDKIPEFVVTVEHLLE